MNQDLCRSHSANGYLRRPFEEVDRPLLAVFGPWAEGLAAVIEGSRALTLDRGLAPAHAEEGRNPVFGAS